MLSCFSFLFATRSKLDDQLFRFTFIGSRGLFETGCRKRAVVLQILIDNFNYTFYFIIRTISQTTTPERNTSLFNCNSAIKLNTVCSSTAKMTEIIEWARESPSGNLTRCSATEHAQYRFSDTKVKHFYFTRNWATLQRARTRITAIYCIKSKLLLSFCKYSDTWKKEQLLCQLLFLISLLYM